MNYTSEYNRTIQGNDIILTPKKGNSLLTLIFLHGMGDSPNGYLGMFDSIYSPLPKQSKVILLCAPKGKLTYAQGYETNSWFDILSKGFTNENAYNFNDVIKNSKKIIDIINEEAKSYKGDYSKIFIGGFSQGACLSLHCAFNSPQPIGGVLALSGVLFPQSLSSINDIKSKESTHIFIGHGRFDDVIGIEIAKASYKPILGMKNVELHEYPMKHSINETEEKDIKYFFDKCLNN